MHFLLSDPKKEPHPSAFCYDAGTGGISLSRARNRENPCVSAPNGIQEEC
jgi:hypothetical protein